MPEKVKAAVLLGPKNIEVREFPYPKNLPRNALVVKMEMSGICGSDKHFFRGEEPHPDFPIILGHENVGTIYEIGEKTKEVKGFRGETLSEGDRVTGWIGKPCGTCWYCKNTSTHMHVYCENREIYGWNTSSKVPPHLFGGWAEYVYVKPESIVFNVPDTISPEVAVLTDTLSSVNLVERAVTPLPYIREGLGLGNNVVIQGSGPIGIMAAVRSRILGAGKIVMIGTPEYRLELGKDFGVDHTINIEEKAKPEERIDDVKRLTNSIGADVVVECTGVPEAVQEGIKMVRKGGTYLLIGNAFDRGPVLINPFDLVSREIRLFGQFSAGLAEVDKSLWIFERYQDQFPFKKLVTHKFKIDDIEKALQFAEKLQSMKAVIVP